MKNTAPPDLRIGGAAGRRPLCGSSKIFSANGGFQKSFFDSKAAQKHSFKIPAAVIFSHPDCTVGSGIKPDLRLTALADFTASREFHPAPKISIYVFINYYNPVLFPCQYPAAVPIALFSVEYFC